MPALRAIVRLSFALVLAGLFSCARAAEQGEPVVLSHVGQPLVADIELTALVDPTQPVTVRLSSVDVYRGANIAMHPVLASVTMTVMRREGRQFLHLTSVKPVDSDYVHVFLDLIDANKRSVRAATLWLTPDPNPAPAAPVAVRPSVPVPVPEAPAPVARPAIVLRQPSAAPSCPQQFSAEQMKDCAAIDYKNGLLSAQIVELEEKVKGLQLAMERRTQAAPKPAVKKAAPAPALAAPTPLPKPVGGFPWLLVSGIVLLLAALGGGVFFVLSRRKAKTVETAAADSVAWYARLASRFKRKPKPSWCPTKSLLPPPDSLV